MCGVLRNRLENLAMDPLNEADADDQQPGRLDEMSESQVTRDVASDSPSFSQLLSGDVLSGDEVRDTFAELESDAIAVELPLTAPVDFAPGPIAPADDASPPPIDLPMLPPTEQWFSGAGLSQSAIRRPSSNLSPGLRSLVARARTRGRRRTGFQESVCTAIDLRARRGLPAAASWFTGERSARRSAPATATLRSTRC